MPDEYENEPIDASPADEWEDTAQQIRDDNRTEVPEELNREPVPAAFQPRPSAAEKAGQLTGKAIQGAVGAASKLFESDSNKIKINNGDDMADLFEVPQEDDEDIYADDLLDLDVEEDVIGGDMDDLLTVTNEDVMGRRPESKRQRLLRKLYKRTNRPIPPGGLQGMR